MSELLQTESLINSRRRLSPRSLPLSPLQGTEGEKDRSASLKASLLHDLLHA
jgi:hypothetical protein